MASGGNEYQWNVLFARLGFWQATLRRLVVLVPVGGIAGFFGYRAAMNQFIWDPWELMVFFGGIILLSLAGTNWGVHKIMEKLPQKVISYRMDGEGIWVEGKQWSWDTIDSNQPELDELTLPRDQWQEKNVMEIVGLDIEAGNQAIPLMFHSEVNRQEFIVEFKNFMALSR